MYQLLSQADKADAFEAESHASSLGARSVASQAREPKLRSFALILARCESSATLLGWRKQITPGQKRRLDAAIQRLREAAAQVAVRATVRPPVPQRAKLGPFYRIPRS